MISNVRNIRFLALKTLLANCHNWQMRKERGCCTLSVAMCRSLSFWSLGDVFGGLSDEFPIDRSNG